MDSYHYRLIKQTISYIPVGGKMYRTVETLEEVIQIPTIDLTNESSSSVSTADQTQGREISERENSETSSTSHHL